MDLGLEWPEDIDPRVARDLMAAARAYGLPLWQLELLGQCRVAAGGFIAAVARDEAPEYLASVAWHALDAKRIEQPREVRPTEIARIVVPVARVMRPPRHWR